MKALVLAVAIATGGSALCAQEFDKASQLFVSEPEYECIYKYTINNTSKGDTIEETTSCILQIGDSGVGRFCDYTSYSTDSARNCIGADEIQVKEIMKREFNNRYFFDEIDFQNYPGNRISVYGSIAPNYYVYEETVNSINWEISEDIDTICGYECMMATGKYGGRVWQVWFATEIPVSMGPWKFGGLPGLILSARDSDNIHRFEAISFRKGDVPIYLPSRPQSVKIDRNKYIKQKNEFENLEDPMSSIPVEAVQGVAVYKVSHAKSGGMIAINNVPLRMRENGYTPLEIE